MLWLWSECLIHIRVLGTVAALYGLKETKLEQNKRTETLLEALLIITSLTHSSVNVEIYTRFPISNQKCSPVSAAEWLPNLVDLSARYCGIKSIARKHFSDSNKLTKLFSVSNQIETVYDETFADLVSNDWIFSAFLTLFSLFEPFFLVRGTRPYNHCMEHLTLTYNNCKNFSY